MPHYHCDISNQACVTVLSYSNKYQYRNHHHQHYLSEHRHHQALCRPTQYRLRSNSPGSTLARYVGTSLTLSLLLNIPRYRYDHQSLIFVCQHSFLSKGDISDPTRPSLGDGVGNLPSPSALLSTGWSKHTNTEIEYILFYILHE